MIFVTKLLSSTIGMPITALPVSTRQLLGSTLAISTPVTVIKELLDNALDASATAVDILVSPNTLDKIEVRDNGNGIHPDDYSSLAKHGHTSKLKSFDDLKLVGSTTLGFRGQALASLNSLAQVVVTTKTSSDSVAATLQIAPKTGVEQIKSAPAPVGTTVSVTGLYSQFPVRKKQILEESPTALCRIKDLLHSYAMARPQVKLTFKVLKTPKRNWSYSPKRDAGIREAVLQIYGTETTNRCIEHNASFSSPSMNDGLNDQEGPGDNFYAFESIMAKPDANCKLPRQRHFSIDGRPISASRGTTKKLVSICSKYLGNALDTGAEIASSDVFMVLNIKAPPGSYDANIEPSKNDLLFSEEDQLLDCFERLCKEVYGPLKNSPKGLCNQTLALDTVQDAREAGGAILYTTGSSPQCAVSNIESDQHIEIPGTLSPLSSSLEDQPSRTDQSVDDEEGVRHSQAGTTQTRPFQRKLSTPALRTCTSVNSRPAQNLHRNPLAEIKSSQLNEVLMSQSELRNDMSTDRTEHNKEPQRPNKRAKSSQSPMQRGSIGDDSGESAPRDLNLWTIAQMTIHPTQSHTDGAVLRSEQLGGQGALLGISITPQSEHNVLHHRGASFRNLYVPPSQRYPDIRGSGNQMSQSKPGGVYRSPASSPMGPSRQITARGNHRQSQVSSQRRAQPPWTPPSSIGRDRGEWDNLYDSRRRTVPDGLKQTTISFSRPKRMRSSCQAQDRYEEAQERPSGQVSQGGNPVRHNIQNMFSSARDNLAHQLQNSHAQEDAGTYPVAHSTRNWQYNKTQADHFASLRSTHVQPDDQTAKDKEPIKTSLPKGDPRAYLLRRQKSLAAEESSGKVKTFRRLKGNLIPLENTPPGDEVYSVLLPTNLTIEQLEEAFKQIANFDKYVVEGDIDEGLDMDLGEGRRIECRLNELLTCWNQELTGEKVDVQCGLGTLLKGKGAGIRVEEVQSMTRLCPTRLLH
ncbi:uncharacterized protein BCR38DRAFT_429056 [Pseudomassariella vexata]|uniref:DNA mismatch repair protein S5 domain-containing protein n=1 Tax=Pseudomassariella vexata TaxID=1141098 RepID=A0A1Y2E3C4_9PEZI|nr:uncharacterized protein BCR38DRAFT_429056 [Pseudomassariella vexata]ORY66032.1 hypothetical protein BCR38DRAFT_429056 [Pseudomassariella vexata]